MNAQREFLRLSHNSIWFLYSYLVLIANYFLFLLFLPSNLMNLLSLLGSLSERMAEKIKGLNKKIEDFVVKRLCCGLISCLRLSHSCIKRFLRTAISYLDLVTDSMLLSAVVTVAFVSNINFTLFPSQIAILLLSSIIIPLLVSAIMVATRRPLVILDAYQWREFTTKNSKLPVFISRLVILLFFPIIPAMIINSDEEWNR